MFETILNFVLTYWRQIFDICCVVVSVIILIIKKRPVINVLDEIKKDILTFLPDVINSVEAPGNGEEKLAAVIEIVHGYLIKKYGSLVNWNSLDDFIIDSVESILSTPTKKGD